jgi:PAS domain S-box-containing protein
LALEAAQLGTFDLDIATDQARCNRRHRQIFGYDEKQSGWGTAIMKQHLLPEDLGKFEEAVARALVEGEFDLEARIRWPDGTIRWFHDHGRVYYDAEGRPVRIVGVTIDTTERQQAQMAEMRQRIIQGQEAERTHLAREIHDGPVQELVVHTFDLATLANQLHDESLQVQLAVLRTKIGQIINRLRHIMVTMRPPALIDFGLATALDRHLLALRQQQPDLVIEADMDKKLPLFPEEMVLALYRIGQQALYNVVTHAQAKHVWVRLLQDSSHLILEVADDGRGFEVPKQWVELARQRHLGIVGMVERAQALDGQLEITSAPGRGTKVQAIIPLPEG